ncbi:hypothetical protein pipiens_002241 [Culex pipiens pipiens]|uniref:C2H2-type domain-containing protein n=1 Tax=Culex pipiens pipiens TaxID=38569 RepID=A0ABD1DI19_CULPP
MESSGLVAVPSRGSVLPVGPSAVKEEPGSLEVQDGCGEGTGAGGSKQKQKGESQLILVMEPQNPSPTKYFDQNGVPLKKEETGPEQVKVVGKSKRTKLTITCHKCRRMFETKVEFEFHYRKAYNQEPVYACGQCDKQILQYKAYRLHCYRHSNSATQRYTCAVCAKVFHQKSDLTRHEAIHETAAAPAASKQFESEQLPIGCDRCDAVFGSQAEVRVHVRKIHPVPKQMIECPDCGKFLSAGSLYSHRKIHSVDGPRFRCEDCDKSFVQKINFIHHRKKHLPNDERPFQCSECDKAFFEKSHLQRHQFFHSEVRPFKCLSCGKCYKTERCLKVHSAVHSAARPFVCLECNKGFLSSSKLRQHTNIHSPPGSRPFKCKYCARDFTNFPNWLKHIRRRHKVDHRTGEKLDSVPKFMTKKKVAVESVAPKKAPKKIKDPPPPLSSIKEESLPFVGDNSNIDLNLVSKDDLLPPLKMEEMGDIFLSLPEGVVNEDARDGVSSPEKDRRTTAPAAEEEGDRKEESLPEAPLGLGAGDDGVLFRFGYGGVVDDGDGQAEFDCDFSGIKGEFAADEAATVIRESETNGAGAILTLSPPNQLQQQQQQQLLSHSPFILSGGGGDLSIFPALISICGGVGADQQQQFQLINPHFLHLPPQLLRRSATSEVVPPSTDGGVGLKLESP